MPAGRKKRGGSRAALAAALAGVVVFAFTAAPRLADLAADAAGISSPPVRLALKVAAVVAALPAGFYLVEELFLRRGSRRAPGP